MARRPHPGDQFSVLSAGGAPGPGPIFFGSVGLPAVDVLDEVVVVSPDPPD